MRLGYLGRDPPGEHGPAPAQDPHMVARVGQLAHLARQPTARAMRGHEFAQGPQTSPGRSLQPISKFLPSRIALAVRPRWTSSPRTAPAGRRAATPVALNGLSSWWTQAMPGRGGARPPHHPPPLKQPRFDLGVVPLGRQRPRQARLPCPAARLLRLFWTSWRRRYPSAPAAPCARSRGT